MKKNAKNKANSKQPNKTKIEQNNYYINNVENLHLINDSSGCTIENSSKSVEKSKNIFKTLFEYCFKVSMKTILTHLLIPTLVSLFHLLKFLN